MAFVVRQTQGEAFEPPPPGVHNAVCVDMIDQGMVMGKFGPKHKIRFVFELEMRNQNNQAYWVNEFFTATISEKSNLGKFLAMWRGRPIGQGEEIDIEKCIGIYALLVIDHQTRDGKTYARINGIQRPVKKFQPSGTYDGQATRQRMMQSQAQQRSDPRNYQQPHQGFAPGLPQQQQPVNWRQPTQQNQPQPGFQPAWPQQQQQPQQPQRQPDNDFEPPMDDSDLF